MSSTEVPRVVPAQLSFLAIYNPALGDSDETFHKQIVFYYSRAAKAGRGDAHANTSTSTSTSTDTAASALREEENEKLRQVGLAQGMVGFARSFSHTRETVDSIETDRARIVLHELEGGWWLLASIDLTQLPASTAAKGVYTTEYSSREVSPPALLIQQLVRAHRVFTLHHGWPLHQLFEKHGRAKFCSILATYWSRFCQTWDVLLHGSPAVDMFNGLKLAAGGELGMGVGEEEWGSSERDVLEDFARRTEGLVDVVVSRFGEASPLQHPKGKAAAAAAAAKGQARFDAPAEPWVGCRGNVAARDGVVFSGVGGLSRASLRDVAHWTETIYHFGDHAYGIRDNPTSDRRKRRRRNPNAPAPAPAPTPTRQPDAAPATPADQDKSHPHGSGTGEPLRIPPPIVKAIESSLDKASKAVDDAEGSSEPAAKPETGNNMLASLGDTETWVKYMTLGYGTAWGGGGKKHTEEPTAAPASAPAPEPVRREQSPEAMRYIEPTPDVDLVEEKRKAQVHAENDGYFLIGLKGDMGETDLDDDNWNVRIPLRTIYVEKVVDKDVTHSESDGTPSDESQSPNFPKGPKLAKQRLRPVIYIHRPFIYTFLFTHRTPSLTLSSFYRSLHSFFSPLHRSLDRNTAPSRVAARLLAAANPQTTTSSTSAQGPNTSPIYDLVWDPRTLTVHSSLPNIPDPGTLIAEGLGSDEAGERAWSRIDALNVHSQIIASLSSTRRSAAEIERTCKTSRGWWIVWMRLPPSTSELAAPPPPPSTTAAHASDPKSSVSQAYDAQDLREAFLVRRARDGEPAPLRAKNKSVSGGVWSGLGMATGASLGSKAGTGGKRAGWGPKGLAEGIGIDARRYVDELLSLNR